MSQHLPNVVFQGVCPTIIAGESNTILGDPSNYLVLIQISRQLDGPHAYRRPRQPWRVRGRGLLSSGSWKRAEGKESPWLLLLLADVHAAGEADAGQRQEHGSSTRTPHHFFPATGLPKMTALGLRSRYPLKRRTERAAAETSCNVRVSSYITDGSLTVASVCCRTWPA